MNPLGTLGKLATKPSDKKIRTFRIIFALLLIAIIVFGFNATDIYLSFFDIKIFDIPYDQYILPILFVFPLVGLIRGIFDPGLFRKAVWKWVIFWLGAAMAIISLVLLTEKDYTPIVTSTDGKITAQDLEEQKQDIGAIFATISTDNFLFLFGIITMFVGFFLTGKNLTTRNEKFGEVIKKIRV